MREITLHPDRLLPADPSTREVARRIYAAVKSAPIISPHGHVDPALLADDIPFPDPAALFITPDHYVTRLLHAGGIDLAELGLAEPGRPDADPRQIWRLFCQRWRDFRATPSRYWLENELVDVFNVHLAPSADSADALFDALSAQLAKPEFRPRALFQRFNIEVLATTDDPASDLAHHRKLAADDSFAGRVVPTFRPDAYLNLGRSDWPDKVAELAAAADIDTSGYRGYIAAFENRRAYFIENGATATDTASLDAQTQPLADADAERIYAAALRGQVSAADAAAFRAHMLSEMARMSCDDGLVMQLHAGVLRDYDTATFARFGPDTGHDIPTATEFTRALRPMLERYGNHPRFRIALFTVDEDTFSREIAPLAGYFPSVYIGVPWWFLDTPDAMIRFREAVTDTAGFYRTTGFVDDTRAFCSIPVRHDTARRVDASYLARLVVEHRIDEDEATETARDLALTLPKEVFRLS
jgi:glucuronate isomerase